MYWNRVETKRVGEESQCAALKSCGMAMRGTEEHRKGVANRRGV